MACGKPQKTAVSRAETEGHESQLRVGKVVNKSTDLRPENLSACVTGRNERGKERERMRGEKRDRQTTVELLPRGLISCPALTAFLMSFF